MKYSELPKEYQALAERYGYHNVDGTGDRECLSNRFTWAKTYEGLAFWHDVFLSESVDELPELPMQLYQEKIKVWIDEVKDIQIGGDHYKKMNIQPIDFILANDLGFCEGNIIKYICRWGSKGGIEDLKKIKHYVDLIIEREYNDL